jgi:hypothetical protein
MADYNQGDIVQDYFTITDDNLVPLNGVVLEITVTEDPDGEDFAASWSEIGDGVYKIEFAALKVGEYYYRVEANGLVPPQAWEENFTIGPLALYGAATGVGAYTNTLADLVKRVAVRLNDFKQATATDNGSVDGTTFVDTVRLAAIPASSLKGAGITIVSPTTSDNYMVERRIADSSEANQTLNITPAFPARSLIGDVAWITNLQSRGHQWDDYKNAINEVIAGAGTFHSVPVDYTYPLSFMYEDPTIPIPLHMTKIYGVQYLGPDGWIYDVPFSDQNVRHVPGWSIDFASTRVQINGSWGPTLNGAPVRLLGYGRPAELVNATDFTTLNTSYLVPAAASILRQSKGDAKLLSSASMMDNAAIEAMLAGITQNQPGTIQVR